MGLLSSEAALRLTVVLLPVLVIYWLLYPWYFSPLRKIPGPWYAVYTKWWLVYKTWRGVRAKTIHDLHLKYGPWVRVAPDEISTSDSKAIAPIYGVNSEFTKTAFYTYQLRGIPELFTMSDRKAHAKRRRELAHLFSMSTITEYEDIIAGNVLECMNLIAAEGKAGRASNLYDWWHYLSMDIICELSFGLGFDMLHKGAVNPYIQDMYGSLTIEPIRWHFGWLNRYASWAPFKFVRDAEACSVRGFERGTKIVQEYKRKEDKGQRKDLLQKMINARDENDQPLPEDDLNIQSTSFILAGSHTTSSSLTWIVWRILANPEIHQKLNQELDDALGTKDRHAVPPHSKLDNLSYLNCIIKEGLRIDTSVPGSTPRYVPPEGAVLLGDYKLPGGTIVSIQAYTTHRQPDVFPDPDRFWPERWLDETPEMRHLYVPFGADGPRKCIGIHLAYMELRVILAALFHRFDLRFAGPVSDESMDMHELWLAAPAGQNLSVIASEKE
ncbi:uncharacterized protein Z520_02142 [Fonsecaea multimorphosa CBS 102226]|uniref:Cytochrome P450 monooxygenase n=1 Tax=Fonsecaea multimorphosa CBS 102226 TaxID=1442371 RepID=A0A0D2KYW6_9EURO|nr:uncharacterized protein Z520_02142 [Fonsecaea multimorphosa CBS 102226]KIY02004.1 hypothetical protein Z520_02142 [Fonsecaea multimorphosa CBS 102226]OAL29685.1 hypothetical protein AYO22_02099 [Fonsecaea multimorphosa]